MNRVKCLSFIWRDRPDLLFEEMYKDNIKPEQIISIIPCGEEGAVCYYWELIEKKKSSKGTEQ